MRSPNWIFSPNIIWKKQGLNEQLNIGIYGEKGPYAIGFWYRDDNNLCQSYWVLKWV